jgi:hypothetical protein
MRGGGRRRCGGGYHGRQNSDSGRGLNADVRTGPLTAKSHAVSFFQLIQNWLKLVKSKWMPYHAKKILIFA